MTIKPTNHESTSNNEIPSVKMDKKARHSEDSGQQLHKSISQKKGNLNFSNFDEFQRYFLDLYKNTQEYYEFVLNQAQELDDLHGENDQKYVKALGSFWQSPNNLKISDLNEKLEIISAVADKIILEYQHKNLPQTNNIAHKNNTLLSKVVDSFKKLLQNIKKTLGFKSAPHVKDTQDLSAERKQEILKSLEKLRAKHKVRPTLS